MLYRLAGSDALYWNVNQRDGVGHTTQETVGNGLITSRGYWSNSAGLSSIQTGSGGAPTSIQSDSYAYDVLGRLAQRADKIGASPTVTEPPRICRRLHSLRAV